MLRKGIQHYSGRAEQIVSKYVHTTLLYSEVPQPTQSKNSFYAFLEPKASDDTHLAGAKTKEEKKYLEWRYRSSLISKVIKYLSEMTI